jgi:adenylylsulfate kinase
MLIAMAGLPGSGKSTLATHLAQKLGGVVLSKDRVRAALFPPPVLDYSTAQNAISMDAIFTAVAHIRKAFPDRPVLIDGRTFLRSYQVHEANGRHPARNRTYALYLAVKAQADPIRVPHLTLDSGTTPLEECIQQCLAYLNVSGPRTRP